MVQTGQTQAHPGRRRAVQVFAVVTVLLAAAAHPALSRPLPLLAAADLALEVPQAGSPVWAGRATGWAMIVTNNGPSASSGGTVTDTLPGGVTLVSAPQCSVAGATLTCDFPSLEVGASTTVTVLVTVDATTSGTLTSTFTVTGHDTDPNPANNSVVATNMVLSNALRVTKTASAPPSPPYFHPWEVVTWTIQVANQGSAPVTGVQLDDTMPTGMSYQPGSIRIDGAPASDAVDSDPAAYLAGSRTVTVDCGTVASGATRTVSFSTTIDPLGLQDGWAVSNGAVVTGPFGTILSDDPATVAWGDGTVVVVHPMADPVPAMGGFALLTLLVLVAAVGAWVLRR